MAEVYWIHLPEHTDVFTQGYVGVTKNNSKARFRGHVQEATTMRRSKTSRMHNYIRKHGKEGLICETLIICEIDYAFDMEFKLRPSERIGWNVAVGGKNAVNPGGYKLSEETRKRMSEARKGIKKSKEAIQKLIDSTKGVPRGPLSKESVDKREFTRMVRNILTYEDTWGKADTYYKDFINGECLTSWWCGKKYGIPHYKLASIFQRFSRGWVPEDDPAWKEAMDIKTTGGKNGP